MKTYDFEWKILELLDKLESDFFTFINWIITDFFGNIFLVAILMIIYWFVDKKKGKHIAFVLAISMCLNNFIKGLFNRTRPFVDRPDLRKLDLAKDGAHGTSFPSGHSMNSASLYTGATFAINNKKYNWLKVVFIVMIFLVGFTRLYLGVHFPTDVLFGIILGCGVTYLLMVFQEKFPKYNIYLYLATLILFLPCLFFEQFGRSFMKSYGMLVGFFFANILEEKYVNFDTCVSFKTKLIRLAIGIVIVGGSYLIYSVVPDVIHDNFIFTLVMHILIMFNGVFTVPFVFTKIENSISNKKNK